MPNALQKYLDDVNCMRAIFEQELIVYPTSKEECEPIFQKLECDLSPENLCCDGEISASQVRAKYRKYEAAWRLLEKIAGPRECKV